MSYKGVGRLRWCLRTRLNKCWSSFEAARGQPANWRLRWLLNLKGGVLWWHSGQWGCHAVIWRTPCLCDIQNRSHIWKAQCLMILKRPKRVDCQLQPDVVMLHLARKNEPHEGILGEWVKRSNVCCSPVHPTPTAVALSVINHNWPTVEAGEKTKKNSKCGSFSLSISFHNRTVLRDLRVQQVARNEFYLAMDADREPPNFCQIFWQFFGHFGENLRFYQGVLSERGIWLSGPIRITLRNSTLSII